MELVLEAWMGPAPLLEQLPCRCVIWPSARSECSLLFDIVYHIKLPHLCVQVEALGKHPHIVVATPGRLLDLVDDEEAPLTLGEWLCVQAGQLLVSSRSVPSPT